VQLCATNLMSQKKSVIGYSDAIVIIL